MGKWLLLQKCLVRLLGQNFEKKKDIKNRKRKDIDRMHKWRPKKYSFVFVLIRPTSLVLKELFFCISSVPTRLVRLISTKTKEHFFGRHLCIRSMADVFFIQGLYSDIRWQEQIGKRKTNDIGTGSFL